MIRRERFLGAAIALVVAAAMPLVPAVARADEAAAPMDHAAMSSAYESEAKAAQAKADEHQLMMNRYKNMPMVPKGSPVTKDAMVQHCQKLVAGYKSVASEAGSLAKAHQEMGQPGH